MFIGPMRWISGLGSFLGPIITAPTGCFSTPLLVKRDVAWTPGSCQTYGGDLRTHVPKPQWAASGSGAAEWAAAVAAAVEARAHSSLDLDVDFFRNQARALQAWPVPLL